MRRIIIFTIALMASLFTFNQKTMAQKRVKVPIFEGIVTAKKGTVNIRQEASAQSKKIGSIQADIIFYPILDQTDEWYRILLPDDDVDSPSIVGKVTCGYVAKAFCKKVMKEDYPSSLSQMVNYLEEKLGCKNLVRRKGIYKQNIIASGAFVYHYNESGRYIGEDDGRFIGVPHKGVMVGYYVNQWLLPDNSYNTLVERDAKFGNMSYFSDGNELTDQQIANTMKYSEKAILFAAPHSYDEEKDYHGEPMDDNMGIEIMYVDMEKYPFKTETIQFNDDESFSYFIVTEEEELERQKQLENEIKNMDEIEEMLKNAGK